MRSNPPSRAPRPLALILALLGLALLLPLPAAAASIFTLDADVTPFVSGGGDDGDSDSSDSDSSGSGSSGGHRRTAKDHGSSMGFQGAVLSEFAPTGDLVCLKGTCDYADLLVFRVTPDRSDLEALAVSVHGLRAVGAGFFDGPDGDPEKAKLKKDGVLFDFDGLGGETNALFLAFAHGSLDGTQQVRFGASGGSGDSDSDSAGDLLPIGDAGALTPRIGVAVVPEPATLLLALAGLAGLATQGRRRQ